MTLEQAIQFLPIIMQQDIRLQVHTFSLEDNEFRHTHKCARCCALKLMGYENDLILYE